MYENISREDYEIIDKKIHFNIVQIGLMIIVIIKEMTL